MYLRMPAWQIVMLTGFIFFGTGFIDFAPLLIVLGILVMVGSMFLMDYEERLRREDQRKREQEKREKGRKEKDKKE